MTIFLYLSICISIKLFVHFLISFILCMSTSILPYLYQSVSFAYYFPLTFFFIQLSHWSCIFLRPFQCLLINLSSFRSISSIPLCIHHCLSPILYPSSILYSLCIHSVSILYLFCIYSVFCIGPPFCIHPQSHSASITVSRFIYTTIFFLRLSIEQFIFLSVFLTFIFLLILTHDLESEEERGGRVCGQLTLIQTSIGQAHVPQRQFPQLLVRGTRGY